MTYYRLWDLFTGEGVQTIRANPGHWRRRGRPGPQGKIVYTEYPDSTRLANVAALTPDGRQIITAGRDERVHVWDVATGDVVASLEGHEGIINHLAISPGGETVATAADDRTLLLWDLRPLSTKEDPRAPEGDLESAWEDLARRDVTRGYEAMRILVRGGPDTIALLQERLRPVDEAWRERHTDLLRDLDSDSFETRQAATRALADLGTKAIPALARAMQESPSPEVRERAGTILRFLEIPFGSFPSESLQAYRSVQVLETIGSDDAKGLLRKLATGSAHALQTREARAALERMEDPRR
jgi:hypothetical protein